VGVPLSKDAARAYYVALRLFNFRPSIFFLRMTHPDERKHLRLFCAVELPPDARARAATHVARLRADAATQLKVSWEREEKMHVTLKFLGEVAPERLEHLTLAASRAAARVAPFELRLEGCGVFPSRSRPSVLWLGISDAAAQISELQTHLEDECARENFPRDVRPFHPHVTVARIRTSDGEARKLAKLHTEMQFEPTSFPVGELVLMRSDFGAGGSIYTALSRHELKGEAK
jgi:2'-5' RNA ligase